LLAISSLRFFFTSSKHCQLTAFIHPFRGKKYVRASASKGEEH
jgi:hypothetical protein